VVKDRPGRAETERQSTHGPKTLRGRILALAVAIVLPLVALTIHSTVAGFRESKRFAAGLVVNHSSVTGGQIDRFVAEAQALARNLAALPSVRDMSVDRCEPWIEESDEVFPQYTNVLVVDRGGSSVCSGLDPVSGASPNYSDRDWFRDVLLSRAPVVGRPRFGRHSGTWALAVASPVLDERDSVLGAVAVGIDLKRFSEFFDTADLPENSIVTVVDSDGNVIARSVDFESWVGRTLPGNPVEPIWYSQVSGFTEATSSEGEPMVWGFLDMQSVSWRLYTGVPADWVYGAARRASIQRAFFVLIGLVSVLLVGAALYRRVTEPLRDLVTVVKNLSVDHAQEIEVDGPTEITEVVDAFNHALGARREARDEEIRARQFFQSIFFTAPLGAYVSTLDGKVLQANEALVTMLGCRGSDDLVGRDASRFHADFEHARELVREANGQIAFDLGDITWVNYSDKEFKVNARGLTGIGADGEDVLVIFADDVSGKREMQKRVGQSQKLEAVGQLSAGVVSDFSDLLTALRGNLDWLTTELQGGLSTEGEDVFEEMHAAIDVAAVLTKHLSMVSNTGTVRPSANSINGVLEDLETLLGRLLPQPIELKVKLETGIGNVLIDKSQLEQVVINLVVNSRDAIDGPGTISVETRLVVIAKQDSTSTGGAKPGRYAMLTVVDTGRGMESEVRDRAFEPFFSTKENGPGLGLTLVRQVAQDCGGAVLLDSIQGEGCRVRVLFPIAVEVTALGEQDEGTMVSRSAPVPRERYVLLAEDHSFARDTLSRVLRGAGFRVVEAADGREALKILRSDMDNAGTILADVAMPGLTGVEFARHARELIPGIPVIFMASGGEEILNGDASMSKDVVVLTKPTDGKSVIEALNMFFELDPNSSV